MNRMLEVHGIGVINARGRGGDGTERQQDESEANSVQNGRIAPKLLKDGKTLKKLRRADRFSKMAALAAQDAVDQAAAAGMLLSASNPGIVLSTAFGPHQTTFDFLDDIIDFGDHSVSPTKFSHSVHNAAAAYMAIMLASRGPACTVTDFNQPFHAALLTAAVWLNQKRCEFVLAGYAEEASAPMEYILRNQALAGNGQTDTKHRDSFSPTPFKMLPQTDACPAEGSVFLALSLPQRGGTPLDINLFKRRQDSGDEGIADIDALRRYLASNTRPACHFKDGDMSETP